MKLQDVLASHIAIGVIHMINECGCKGLMREVMNEINQSEPSEADCRNISIFLENIATAGVELIVPILDDMMDYLESEVCTFTLDRLKIIHFITFVLTNIHFSIML